MKNHIDEGRHELNFSIFNTYAPPKRFRKLAQICEQTRSAEMPPSSYLLIHRTAALDERDIETLCTWTARERSNSKEKK